MYLQNIDDIMIDRLKNPNCLINAEELASHISIVTTKSGEVKQANKSGSNSSKSGKSSKPKPNS